MSRSNRFIKLDGIYKYLAEDDRLRKNDSIYMVGGLIDQTEVSASICIKYKCLAIIISMT